MNADSFERLSKRMGAATTRRGLLRAFAAGVSAALVGAVMHVPETHAQHPCTTDLQCGVAQRCDGGVCVADSDPAALAGNPPSSAACGELGLYCCAGACPGCPVCICESGTCQRCGGPGARCCPGSQPCGNLLFCNSGGYCQFCAPGYTCGSTCCAPNERCFNGTCTACGYIGQTCCPDGTCISPLTCQADKICQLF